MNDTANNYFSELYNTKYNKKRKPLKYRVFLEAQTGFEPVDTGVADHCLTTWLLRQIFYYPILK